MNIDWFEIEERLAYLDDKPDCIPEDIREWTHFREQYENALDFIKNYKSRDFSKPDMTEEFLNEKLLEIGCLGYGFKKSIFEIIFDNKTRLIPELDWETIKNFELFFEWNIYLGDRNLTVLPPLPKHIGGDLFCDNNTLTTLEGAPQHVDGHFWCGDNKLTSLEGAPQHVGRYFSCYNNQLTTLEGAPQHVGGYFYCEGNNKLPKSIPKNFLGKDLPKYINIKESIILSFSEFVNESIKSSSAEQMLIGYLQAAIWTEEEQLQDTDELDSIQDEVLYDILKNNTTFDFNNAHLYFDADSQLSAFDDIKMFIQKSGIHGNDEFMYQAGIDFWLNRNGHGSGFWDKENIYDDDADKFSDIAKSMGNKYVFIGNDNKLYFN